MGLTGELVRTVFSNNRSVSAHESNERNVGVDRSKWSFFRSYLCGNDHNSVQKEDDSASIKSSEATVTQPMPHNLDNYGNQDEIQSGKDANPYNDWKQNLSTSSEQEIAAIIIQTAFRGFMARRKYREARQFGSRDSTKRTDNQSEESESTPMEDCQHSGKSVDFEIPKSSYEESLGTSVKVQTGDSADLRNQDHRVVVHHKVLSKPRTQISRLKEEWDDSTVSSNISKMRIQNRLEASTRRERALAYAFSQQLRTCNKKKLAHSDSTETNLGWSWLERWMAARQPEQSSIIEDRLSKCCEPTAIDQRSIIKMKFDFAGEVESCGSNDVSVAFDALSISEKTVKDGYRPTKKG